MEAPMIWGMPAINFQALLGVFFLFVTYVLVKLIRGIQTGRYLGSNVLMLYLRTLLGFSLTGGVFLFFASLLGYLYI